MKDNGVYIINVYTQASKNGNEGQFYKHKLSQVEGQMKSPRMGKMSQH